MNSISSVMSAYWHFPVSPIWLFYSIFYIFFLFFFFYVKEIPTPSPFWGGGEWRGSAGLQPTKTSTMTDSAAIERDPGTGASDTPGSSRAQNASSPEQPYKAVWFPYRTAWRSRGADLSAPNFDPHRGKRRPWSALSKRVRGVCRAPADRSSRGGNSAPSLFPLPPSEA